MPAPGAWGARDRAGLSCSARGASTSLLFLLLAAAAGLLLCAAPATAQRQRNQQGVDPNTTSAVIESSAPVEEFFRRAGEAVGLQDWKLAVDSLQRIIDDPQGGLYSRDETIYESARRQAYRLLIELPPAGQETYHLLYDSEAGALLDQAVAAHDGDTLQQVVDRYLLTPAGGRAAAILASWRLDTGSPGAAVALLTTAQDLCPAASLPPDVPALLAVAYHQLGWQGQARAELERLASAGGSRPGQAGRVQAVDEYLSSSPGRPRGAASGDGWIATYGNPGRGGIMPETIPALQEGLPWRVELPGGGLVSWPQLLEQRARLPWFPFLPQLQLVTDGRTLFAKSGRQLMAVDPVSFDVLWTMRPPTDDLEFNSLPPQLGGLVLAQPAVMARALGEADPEQAVAAALLDDLAVQISVGHGLVYTLDVQADQQDQRNATALRNRQAIVPQYFLPNRVIACDIARDGEIAWMLGAGTPVSQGSHLQARFDAARFAAAPLPVGDDLLLPYWFDKDLYIAFVDPRTGDVREDLHLCTLRDTADAWRYSLPPAVDETLAFIPTNGGLLLAVDLLGRSIVWASRYTRQPYEPARPETLWNTLRSSQSRFASTMHWLPGPPVVAGAAVLLAAPDSDELLAFERSTGRILWSCPRADASYIVAADADHVWLAGPQVTKVAVRDGSIVWSADVGPATGRAVVSGGRVLVPTSRALVALDAETGRPLQDQPLPEDHAPLGNLLCSGGALYSIDTVEIRKFPDLQRSYEESCRLQQAAPEEPGPGIRLAWMELLRHQPQRVLEVLKRIDSSKADPRQAAQIAHLHVQALIEGVRGGAWPAGAGQARLEQAMSIATSPRDRVEAALALVELLHANGQDREAFRRGWDSLQHLAVNELVTCGSGWRRPASALLEESLSELLEEMSEDDVAALTAELHPDVLDEEATSKRREDVMLRLDRIAEGPSVGNWSYLAALKIGRWKVHLREYERAEYYLHLAADLAGTPEEQAAALHALGQLYARDDLDLPGLLEPVARRLISTYPTVEIGGRPAAEIAREWLDAVAEAKPAAASFKGPATTSDEWHEGALASTHIVDFGGMLPVRLGDSVILMSAARTLVACRATDGKRLWEAPLRMLTEPMFEPEVLVRRQVAVRCRGHSRDQILLVNTETALHAVGLVTGRRLWYVPFEYPVEGWSQSADYYDIAGGRVVVRQGPHRVQLLRSCDGRVEWEARVADMRVVQVRIHDRRVVLMGESGRRVGVLDLASGAPVFTTELDNDAPPLGYEPPVAAGAVWGLNLSALVGTDLLDGRERFRQRLPEGFSATAVFSAGEDYVVAGGAMGHVMVVDSRSGEVLATRQLPFASLGVRGGVAAGERLVFWGLTQGDSMQILQLAAMDLPSGEAAWRTGDLGVPLDWRTNLSMLRSRIPLVYDPPGPKREALPEFITGTGAALVFLDKQTGQVADLPIPLPDAGAQYTGECLLLPHRIVLGTETRAVRIALPGLVGE